MRLNYSFILFFFTVLLPFASHSQNDSLLNIFNNSLSNEEQFYAALELSDQTLYIDIESSKKYLKAAEKIAQKSSSKIFESEYNLQLFEVLSYENKESECVELMIETIDICKKNNLTSQLGHAYNKLGAIYINIQLLDKAETYFELANETFKQNLDFSAQKNTLNNLGAVYYYQNDFNNAIKYFEQSLDIEKQLGNEEGIAETLGNIGAMYCKLDPPDYVSAEKSLQQALEISKKINNPELIVGSLNNLTYYYLQLNELSQVEKVNQQALVIAKGNNLIKSTIIALENKLELLRRYGDYEYALETALEIQDYNSELYSSENTKALAQLESIYQTTAKQKENELLKKQSEIDRVTLNYEKQKSVYLFIGLAIVAALGIFAFNRFLISQKRKRVIEKQKLKVEEQKELLHQQNEIVKEKNSEISDSITYAKRIQSAILPPIDALNYHLKNGFLIFQPKDIVSGDFYWMFADEKMVYFAVADCTGHGVPGAMVSVVCNNALNRSIREYGLRNPDEILNNTRELVIENFSLNHTDSNLETIKDGMDISLCALNKETKELMWAGANNPVWIIRKGKLEVDTAKVEVYNQCTLTEISGDKQPIGMHENLAPFTCHKIQLHEEDEIIIFSDGFADQFGGEKGKKLKYKPFKQMLLQNFELNMEEQKNTLEQFFTEWKGDYEQIDDVCVIGVKL